MTAIAEKAHEYRSELQKLLDLNFDNPNEELKEFTKKNNMDIKDSKVQMYFLDIRKKYIEDINKFYEKNFLNFNNTQNATNSLKDNAKKASVNTEKKNLSKNSVNNTNNEQIVINKPSVVITNSNKDTKIDKKPITEREFLKKNPNEVSSLTDAFRKYISPPIFFGILFVSLALYFFKNHSSS
jgi:hypothetical protein